MKKAKRRDFMDAKKVRPIGTHRKSVSPDCCYTIIYPFNGYRKKKKTLFAKVFSHNGKFLFDCVATMIITHAKNIVKIRV